MAQDTSRISHYFSLIQSPKYAAWRDGGASPRRFSMEALIGTIEMKPTKMIATNGTASMDLSGCYMFQRSEITDITIRKRDNSTRSYPILRPASSSTPCSAMEGRSR
jgi:hypothetical protein